MQFCCGQGSVGSPSFSTFAAGQLGTKNSSCPDAAAFAVRRLATATTNPSTSQKLQETAKGKVQSMLAGPNAAVQSARQSVRNTTNAVYKQMPRPVSLVCCATWCLVWYCCCCQPYTTCQHAGSALGHHSGQARWSATGCYHSA